MIYRYFPSEFSSYEDYVKYLKEKGFAIDVPEENNKNKVMTQEEKELLLKDLCGRLPYGTIYDIKIGGVTYVKVSLNSFYYGLIEKNFNNGQLQSIIPYLKKNDISFEHKGFYLENLDDVIDYYNSNHIDYRGFIQKGLANEAPEEMYK